jgi:hypothetical protein
MEAQNIGQEAPRRAGAGSAAGRLDAPRMDLGAPPARFLIAVALGHRAATRLRGTGTASVLNTGLTPGAILKKGRLETVFRPDFIARNRDFG